LPRLLKSKSLKQTARGSLKSSPIITAPFQMVKPAGFLRFSGPTLVTS
jgi:hypothetical protein